MIIINKLLKSTKNSINGLLIAFKIDKTISLEFILTIPIVIIAFFLFEINKTVLIIFLWFAVIIVELINTSIEKTLDFITLKKNKDIKIIKDISSAAVFLTICLFIFAFVLLLLVI